MRPALGHHWDIHLKENRAYLIRQKDKQVVSALTGIEAFILGLMDGSRSIEELSSLLTSVIGDIGANALNSFIARLGPLLVDGHSRQIPYSLETLAQVRAPDIGERLHSFPGPQVLHWCVTDYCPRHCAYCFAQPKLGNQAKDSILTRDQLKQIFKEAASLGAKSLLVSGAEPLLRIDLPEVMGDAIKYGITPLLTTKHPITKFLAHRFAIAGVRHISLSLDTMNKEESRILIGNSYYPMQVRCSARNLVEAGIAFSIQAVATRLNYRSILTVAAFASDAGAKVLQVVPFESVQVTMGDLSNETMTLEHLKFLQEEVAMLAQRFSSLKIELFEELGKGSKSRNQCDIGLTKLFFLPNGVVHRCYKLINDDRLQGADLRKVSVAAGWHDPLFREIISPPREAYSGSECWSCKRFVQCHQEGRCIYQALVSQGRFAARDRLCSGPYF